MKPYYQEAASLPGVAIVANSEAGARDYEEWLGLDAGCIGVLRNAFLAPTAPRPEEIDRLRLEQGLAPETPVIACVFRLDAEKRPLLVVSLLARLHAKLPGLRVLMAGCGPLEEAVRSEVRRHRLESVVRLLGQRQDVPVILAASQVMLLASEIEGTPNVVLEAQHFGCVPVLTDAGGSRETIVPGETGLLRGKDDLAGLVADVESLLRDPARRRRMAEAGRRLVAQRFDPERIHVQTLALYERLLPTATLPRAA
jgi:glycosyltransferase involved in cell wall biosynthesis